MKQVYSAAPTGVLVMVLLSIFAINGAATYLEFTIVPNIIKFVAVIVILTVYFARQLKMATVFLTVFLLLFLGDMTTVFNVGDVTYKISKSFYLGSYLLLIFILMGNFKRTKFEGLVSIYLGLILLLNTYFLYTLYAVIKDNFSDSINLVLYICHGITLIAMGFLAFAVYLSKESTQSIIFLVMVFCLIFSDVLNYICDLYVYFWVFDFVGEMLHLASLWLFHKYVSNHHKIIKVKRNVSSEDYVINNTDRLPA